MFLLLSGISLVFMLQCFFWEVNRSFDEYFQYHEPSSMLEILNDCWLYRENMSNEIFASNKKKESARKAAKSRHAETDSMKEEVLKIYDENKEKYRSVADASRKLSRVVPVTDRTIDKWIRQRKKNLVSLYRVHAESTLSVLNIHCTCRGNLSNLS